MLMSAWFCPFFLYTKSRFVIMSEVRGFFLDPRIVWEDTGWVLCSCLCKKIGREAGTVNMGPELCSVGPSWLGTLNSSLGQVHCSHFVHGKE